MRIWHEKLIPNLCRQHLLSVWREGLGAYSIIIENKSGYRNHPAVKEFENCPQILHRILGKIQGEMLARGYNPKALPVKRTERGKRKPWQTLQEQIAVIKSKNCQCLIT